MGRASWSGEGVTAMLHPSTPELFITSGPSPGGRAPLCSAGHSALQSALPGGSGRGGGALRAGPPEAGAGARPAAGLGSGAEAAGADKGRGRPRGETVRDAASSHASEEPAPALPVSYSRSRGLSGVPCSQLRAQQPGLSTQEAVGDGLQRAHSVPDLSYLTWKMGAGASSYSTGLLKVELALAGEGPLWIWAFGKGWLPHAPLMAPAVAP